MNGDHVFLQVTGPLRRLTHTVTCPSHASDAGLKLPGMNKTSHERGSFRSAGSVTLVEGAFSDRAGGKSA
jgi:hypothetical protein